MRAIGRSRAPKSTSTPIFLTSHAKSIKRISILRNCSCRWRKEKNMTASLSTSSGLSISVPEWHMPVVLENYPNPDPCVTDEEAALLDFYATEANGVTGGLAGAILAQLERFDQPFRDALRLHTKYDRVTARSRRHLFRYMVQTRRAFWAWSNESWSEVIQTTTGGSHRNEGMRFGMLTLAYLFSGFLYAGEGTPYIEMADAIFGEDRIPEEANKLHAPLVALGYSEHGGEKKRFLPRPSLPSMNFSPLFCPEREWTGDKIWFACKPHCAIWAFWTNRSSSSRKASKPSIHPHCGKTTPPLIPSGWRGCVPFTSKHPIRWRKPCVKPAAISSSPGGG